VFSENGQGKSAHGRAYVDPHADWREMHRSLNATPRRPATMYDTQIFANGAKPVLKPAGNNSKLELRKGTQSQGIGNCIFLIAARMIATFDEVRGGRMRW
jgi:hypothetical protein